MQDNETFDQDAYHIAVASIRRSAMAIGTWKHTVIGELHPAIVPHCELRPGELPIASGFFTAESWWVITTRRIVSRHGGALVALDPRHGVHPDFGDLKGRRPGHLTEIATVVSARGGDTLRFEFETGAPSMAPIYGCMFWQSTSRFHYRDRDD